MGHGQKEGCKLWVHMISWLDKCLPAGGAFKKKERRMPIVGIDSVIEDLVSITELII